MLLCEQHLFFPFATICHFFLRTSVTCGRSACNSFTALCNSLLSLVTGSFCMKSFMSTHTSISVTSGLIAYKSLYASWSLISASYFLCPLFVGALIFQFMHRTVTWCTCYGNFEVLRSKIINNIWHVTMDFSLPDVKTLLVYILF